MMSDNLNGRCSVFVAFGGGREGLFFLSGYIVFFCVAFPFRLYFVYLVVCSYFLGLGSWFTACPSPVTGPRWTELRGSLRTFARKSSNIDFFLKLSPV